MLSIIVAMSQNRVIGRKNIIPWHLPDDLRNFKKITMGSPIIMGRKTFESLSKALPGRQNIVITHRSDIVCSDCQLAHSVKEALSFASRAKEVFIIGGESIYQETIQLAEKIYLTSVDVNVNGDTFFPEINLSDWEKSFISFHPSDKEHVFSFSNYEYKRKK
jgi:dihydrofolate reductase